MAADHNAELMHTFQAQQELTRAAIAAGPGGVVRRLAERLDGWAVLLDAAGSVVHASPAGAARQAPWLAQELERLRDVATPVSTTLSVDGDQIVVQSLRPERRTRGFLAIGIPSRPTTEQRNVLNTAVSLLTLVLAQASALRTAEDHLRTAIFDLLVNGDLNRAERLATDMWGGLPSEPVRIALVAGRPLPLMTSPTSWTQRPHRRRSDCSSRRSLTGWRPSIRRLPGYGSRSLQRPVLRSRSRSASRRRRGWQNSLGRTVRLNRRCASASVTTVAIPSSRISGPRPFWSCWRRHRLRRSPRRCFVR